MLFHSVFPIRFYAGNQWVPLMPRAPRVISDRLLGKALYLIPQKRPPSCLLHTLLPLILKLNSMTFYANGCCLLLSHQLFCTAVVGVAGQHRPYHVGR